MSRKAARFMLRTFEVLGVLGIFSAGYLLTVTVLAGEDFLQPATKIVLCCVWVFVAACTTWFVVLVHDFLRKTW